MIHIHDAIYKLNPSVVSIRDDVAYDAEGNKVSYNKSEAEAEFAANQYKTNRLLEYPSYADQFDTIFHEGIDAWKAKIQAVKTKYPKG